MMVLRVLVLLVLKVQTLCGRSGGSDIGHVLIVLLLVLLLQVLLLLLLLLLQLQLLLCMDIDDRLQQALLLLLLLLRLMGGIHRRMVAREKQRHMMTGYMIAMRWHRQTGETEWQEKFFVQIVRCCGRSGRMRRQHIHAERTGIRSAAVATRDRTIRTVRCCGRCHVM